MHRENLLTLFAECRRYANDPAVVERRGYRRETWTYRKLLGTALSCALELKDRGIQTGDRVLLWGPNSAEWMAAFWGCLLRGAVAVPMDDGATVEFASRVAGDAAVKLVFCSGRKPSLPTAANTLVLEELSGTLARHDHASGRFEREPLPRIYQTLADRTITRNHIAQILYTSGTTAEPRGVVLTHGNFLANLEPLEGGIDPYRKYEKWLHPLRFLSLVPLSHVFGQFMALFVPLLLGATIVFEPSANPAEMIRTIKRERVTALIAVPRMFDALSGGIRRDLEGRGLASWFENALAKANGKKFLRRAWIFRKIHRRFGWRFWALISGGAVLSSRTEEFFRQMGYAVVQGYGMTETASLISLNHPFRAAEGSIGRVLPGREFRLAADGEILVRGENVSSGYWENATGRAAPREKEEWLGTGDIGELDARGNLRFRGRKKSVIVTPGGRNVYPEDLEAALSKQPGVQDAVVIRLASEGNAEPCAVLVLDGRNIPGAAGAAVEGANTMLAEYQRMRFWVAWPEADFPRTATGKPRLSVITERTLQILAAGGANERGEPAQTLSPVSPAQFPSPLADVLRRFEAASNPLHHLERELRLSSLDRVELMSALEEKFHVELNETDFAGAKTVGDLERLLRQPASQRQEYTYPRWAGRWPVTWLRTAVYYALVWPATEILAHPKVVGRSALANFRGPALIISNHITRRADIGLLLAALPSRYRHHLTIAMGGEALEEMRRPPRDWWFAKRWASGLGYWLVTALFNVFPLPQSSGFRESFRFAGESVDRGSSVLVFPEGRVNPSDDGRMAPFEPGIGLLALNLGIPVIPMRLDGVWQMKREHRRLARPGEITVRIGAPVSFRAGTPPGEIARTLEAMVLAL